MARLTMQRSRVPMLSTSIARVPPKAADPFYLSPAWRTLMRAILAARGRSCQAVGCKAPDAPGVRYGDHIEELRDGGARLDPGNVMVMCPSCHQLKTVKAARHRRGE